MLVLVKEKARPVLEHQTGHKRKSFNPSIPQGIPLVKRDRRDLEKSFRLYLKAILVLLSAREIVR